MVVKQKNSIELNIFILTMLTLISVISILYDQQKIVLLNNEINTNNYTVIAFFKIKIKFQVISFLLIF
jgi:mannitol-specific phosphotransferase system IIBC component